MKTKIYEKNDFKKYFNKNEEFNEPYIPNYIKNSINNTIEPKKSFGTKENKKNNLTFNNQENQSESNIYEMHNNEWNNRPAAYLNTHSTYENQNNNFSNLNQNFFGFSKFLEKKNVYDRLADLRDSIGKRKINSPYLVLSSHENDKKEFYDKITSTSAKEFFVHSPRKIKSLLSINCKESYNKQHESLSLNNKNDNVDQYFIENKKDERCFSSSKSLFHTRALNDRYNDDLDSFGIAIINRRKDDDFNRSSNFINLREENDRTPLSLIVKEPSKVNILHKIEQYKDYLRFKGV